MGGIRLLLGFEYGIPLQAHVFRYVILPGAAVLAGGGTFRTQNLVCLKKVVIDGVP